MAWRYMSQAHHGQCSAEHLLVTEAHMQTQRRAHTLSVAPQICLLRQCWVWLATMQFCRKVLCQPCSARVTSPEEDMEYKMGSCIGISHRQVNRGRGVCLQCSIKACVTEQWEHPRGVRIAFTGQRHRLFLRWKAERQKVVLQCWRRGHVSKEKEL